jgi:plasmid stabilization system protein ParE
MARSPIRYEQAAIAELEQAIDWYRDRNPRVAERFIQATRKQLAAIRQRPRSWAPDEDGIRAARVGGFPYVIVYWLHRRTVVFIAFVHTSRQSGSWRDRLR